MIVHKNGELGVEEGRLQVASAHTRGEYASMVWYGMVWGGVEKRRGVGIAVCHSNRARRGRRGWLGGKIATLRVDESRGGRQGGRREDSLAWEVGQLWACGCPFGGPASPSAVGGERCRYRRGQAAPSQ